MTLHKAMLSVLELPALRPLLREADLKFVDIGGRGKAFFGIMPLMPVAHYYTAEPDVEEAERLREVLGREMPWRSVTVIAQAIAAQRGQATLHLTSNRGMSSLLLPDPVIAARFGVEGKCEVEGGLQVPTIPLDEAAAEYGFTDATFLKLDTQGSELEILQSGPRLVGDSLLGVYSEVEFQPLYKGQALFSDVDQHLRAHGFTLFGMDRTLRRRGRFEASRYSKRVPAWAHCLYLREPDSLPPVDAALRPRQLWRLLALAIAFEHYDLAFEVLALAGRLTLLTESALAALAVDVEAVSAISTQRALKLASKQGIADVLGGAITDKGRFE